MAIDFPASPTNGQEFTSGSVTYVYNGTGWVMKPAGNPYVVKAGDTMTGALVLPANPTTNLQAATKQYVDAQDTAVKVAAAPLDALAYNGMQINGGMEVSQENGFNFTVNADSAAICDGWRLAFSGTMAVGVAAASNTFMASLGFYNYIGLGVITGQPTLSGANHTIIFTRIEGYRIRRLRWGTSGAQPITIGFWSAHTRTGLYSVTVTNASNDRNYATTYTHAVADTPQYNTVTIPGCTDGTWANDNTVGIKLQFIVACGPTYTAPAANVWNTTNYISAPGQVNSVTATSDSFRITGVIVLPGIEAPSAARSAFIMRPYDQELLTCQRYFQKVTNPPGAGAGNGASTIFYWSFPFPVAMRATPTVSISGNIDFSSPTASYSGTSVATNRSSSDVWMVDLNATGAVASGLIVTSGSINAAIADARL